MNLTVRVGCRIAYETSVPTPVLFVLRPRLDGQQLVRAESFSFGASLPSYEFTDAHGNITYRVMLMARAGSPISRSGPIKSIRSKFPSAIRLIRTNASMAPQPSGPSNSNDPV